MVYDLTTQKFRNLNKSNISTDFKSGIIFLEKEALEILKEHFLICGYVIINKYSGVIFPIDIREDGITIFENVFT